MQSSTAQTLPTDLSSPLHKPPFCLQIRFIGNQNQNGVVNILTRLQTEQSDVRFPVGIIDFALLQNIQMGSGARRASSSTVTKVLSWGQSGRDVKLTTGLHLAPRLRMSGTGVVSVFTPSLGTIHQRNTSVAVTVIRIGEFIGSTTRLSVSSSRNVLICWSSCCTTYESNSRFVKSDYS